MELNCKLIEKSFIDADGKSHAYYVLSFNLADSSTMELPVKGDKAKLLRLSNNLKEKDDNKSFWN